MKYPILHKLKRTLIIVPHPDDELNITFSLLADAQESTNIKLVVLTLGENGKNYLKNSTEKLIVTRKNELISTLSGLGFNTQNLLLSNFTDGFLKTQVGWQEYIEDIIEEHKPETLITYGPTGLTEHPDHIVVSEYLFNLSKKLNLELYFATYDYFGKLLHFRHQSVHNVTKPTNERILTLRDRYKKYKSMLNHKSQFNTLAWKIRLLKIFFIRAEYFTLSNKNETYNFDIYPFTI